MIIYATAKQKTRIKSQRQNGISRILRNSFELIFRLALILNTLSLQGTTLVKEEKAPNRCFCARVSIKENSSLYKKDEKKIKSNYIDISSDILCQMNKILITTRLVFT